MIEDYIWRQKALISVFVMIVGSLVTLVHIARIRAIHLISNSGAEMTSCHDIVLQSLFGAYYGPSVINALMQTKE